MPQPSRTRRPPGADLLAAGGCIAIIVGVWMVYPPLAWIVGGLCSLAIAFLWEWGRKEPG